MLRIAVLISGGGSNLESIMNSIDSGFLNQVEIVKVISDRDAKGIEKAINKGYETLILDREKFGTFLSDRILEELKGRVDILVLAGYLSIISGNLIDEFENRIINIHPSLIPSFCGPGMYGMKVHQAAIKKGVKYSGCTVHFVNNEVDAGAIIKQKIVDVSFDDTPITLQQKILKEEHKVLPEVLKLLSENKIKLIDNKVRIL